MKRLLPLVPILFLLLCAFQCEESPEPDPWVSAPEGIMPTVHPNVGAVAVGDTVWLSGDASSRVMDLLTGDSILWEEPPTLHVSFYRLKVPVNERDYNTVLAANEFNFHARVGTVEKEVSGWAYDYWDNLHRIMTAELSPEGDRYSLRVGVIPKSIGYFAFKCTNAFRVDDFNRELYTQFGDSSTYSFHAQGRGSSYRGGIDDHTYFIKVIPND